MYQVTPIGWVDSPLVNRDTASQQATKDHLSWSPRSSTRSPKRPRDVMRWWRAA
jgi:hypothetical protein